MCYGGWMGSKAVSGGGTGGVVAGMPLSLPPTPVACVCRVDGRGGGGRE